MNTSTEYKILRTTPRTYVDGIGNPISGFRITFEIVKYGEMHMVDVPSLNPEQVKAVIEDLLKNRKALENI